MMGILPGLFRKGQPKPDSLILVWAEQRMRETQYENEITPENMFAGLIYALATFVRPEPRPGQRKEKEEWDLYHSFETEFANDSTLFELGCYMYFRVDFWLFRNRRDLHGQISPVFFDEFINLFTEVLGIPNIDDLLAERLDGYIGLTGRGNEIQTYHDHLYELILRTKGNRKPGHYCTSSEHGTFVGALQEFALRAKLRTWEDIMLPTILGSMEKATDMMPRGPIDKDVT
jgi:hypothetical protein